MNIIHEIHAYVTGLNSNDLSVELTESSNQQDAVISIPALNLCIIAYPLQRDGSQILRASFCKEQSDTYQVKGLKLIQIWEDVWIHKQKIVKSRLQSLMGITTRLYARDTAITTIDSKTANIFLDEHHLFGGSLAKFKYGLLLNGELVAVATFSKPRNIHRESNLFRSYELIRYCSKLNYTITGGLSKLLKYFIKVQQPDDIMTYADRDWSDGRVYYKLGFHLEDTTDPQEFWIQPQTYTRIPAKSISKIIQLPVNPKDHENFLINKGYKKAYNSGNLKFIKRFK